VTGYAETAAGEWHAFLATPGQPMEDLGTLGGSQSGGGAINAVGQVTGNAQIHRPNQDDHAVRWTPISLLFSRLLDDVTGVGPGKSLAQKVRIATAYYDANDGPATCSMLRAFGNEVKAQSGKKKLSRNLAQQLMNDARAIRVAIGCEGG
jgi:probable HAF family extracellular repeat protein